MPAKINGVWDTPVRIALEETISELIAMIPSQIPGSTDKTSPENLRWMMQHCLEKISEFPIDKLGRWIGFVQGVLALSGNLVVDNERDKTRNRFHKAYIETGQTIPKSAERPVDVTYHFNPGEEDWGSDRIWKK